MKLRTRLNLLVAGLTAVFVAVLLAQEVQSTRSTVREEMEAANQVASQLLGRLAVIYSRVGGTAVVQQFLVQLGHVRANEIVLRGPGGGVLYHSPPPTYKAGRAAPQWFARLLAPHAARHTFPLTGGAELTIESEPSRAILGVWEDLQRLLIVALVLLAVANGLAFWLIERALAPFPVIVQGLERLQRGELAFRLPLLPGREAGAIGAAFNLMAQAVQDNVEAERKAHEAERRLEERQQLAEIVGQRVEEERRLIAHELHDEFGQSVTAIRSLALAISSQSSEPRTNEAARLISEEAARLYDAMHGLIPRLIPLSIDTLGLAESLENLVRDWQRRYPAVELRLRQELQGDLGPSVTLTAYRVVQEGLINALRHAQAQRIEIEVTASAERMTVRVRDDGIGLPADWSRPGHFGLRGLADRVAHLGGTLKVAANVPRGVNLSAEIPLSFAA